MSDYPEVFSESLGYNQLKRRAVSARSYRVKLPPSNSTSFKPDETIQFDLPSNMAASYYNFNQMYLKFTVTPDQAVYLDRGGAFSCFKRLQIQTAGAQLADINNYNVLCTAMLDTDSSCEYKAGYGNVLLGTLGDALRGEQIAAAASRTYCMPIICNCLANTQPHKLIPAFSLSSIQLRLTIDSLANMVRQVTGAAPTVMPFTNVELCMMVTELSPEAQRMIDASTNGLYQILASNFMNSIGTKSAASLAATVNLGFSVTSLERIIAVQRRTDQINSLTAYSLGNRIVAGLNQYQYLINNKSYPERPVTVGGLCAEALAETLIADHSLVDFKKSSTINNGFVAGLANGNGVGALSGVAPNVTKAQPYSAADSDGASAGAVAAAAASTASSVGSFIVGTEFESGLSDGKSSTIYSGISTIASTVQFLGYYTAIAQDIQLDFFAQYTVLLILDMKGSGVWSIKV